MKYSFPQDSQIYFILTILRTNIFGLHLHSGQTSIGEIHHFQHLIDTLVKQYGLNVKELKTDEREVPVMKCQKSLWHLKFFDIQRSILIYKEGQYIVARVLHH